MYLISLRYHWRDVRSADLKGCSAPAGWRSASSALEGHLMVPTAIHRRYRLHRLADALGRRASIDRCAKDCILGAHVIDPMTGGMFHGLCATMEFGASAENVARTGHTHETLFGAMRKAALACGDGAIHA